MRTRNRNLWLGAAAGWLAAGGCSPPMYHLPNPPGYHLPAPPQPIPQPPRSPVVPAAATEPAPAPPAPSGVDDFVRIAVERNPRLARARFGVDAAGGRLTQAGLYPNPVFSFTADEIGDRTGPSGILTPAVFQEVVTAGKLGFAQQVAAADVDQSVLGVLAEQYALAAAVRAAYCDALVLQERVAVLDKFVAFATEAVRKGREQVAGKQIPALDLLQLETERETFRADAEAARRELVPAYRRLAAVVGDPTLPVGPLSGSLAAVPRYDLEAVRAAVRAAHPEVRTAKVGVARAQAAVRKAEADRVPNVTLTAGYTYQGQNRSNDGGAGFTAPVPVWNRNQGNIRAARAELGQAVAQVGRAEADLDERVAAAFRTYAAGRERAERYRAEVLPRAVRAAELTLKAFEAGGELDTLKLLQSQRAVTAAGLEYNASLGQAWRAAAELSGLLLEEAWPGPGCGPGAAPVTPPQAPSPSP
jgi:cobalt-zinc-cadmium efflux system outer membrane protein